IDLGCSSHLSYVELCSRIEMSFLNLALAKLGNEFARFVEKNWACPSGHVHPLALRSSFDQFLLIFREHDTQGNILQERFVFRRSSGSCHDFSWYKKDNCLSRLP